MLFYIRLILAQALFHPLEGLTWDLRRQLFREEGKRFPPRYWLKLVLITLQSAWESYFSRRVDRKFGPAIASAAIQPPVFILGHYRSGTTYLHELMSLDPRFASPTRFQAYHPGSFLATERWYAPINDLFMLPRRVQEDEIALMNLCCRSPYLDWCFPDSGVGYSKFLTFRQASRDETDLWKRTLRWYLGALSVRYGKPILLKSPPHTARIGLILEVFPDAKFVHIRRNPFDVFASTVKLLEDLDPVFRLQVRRGPVDEEVVLRTYEEMYDAYFEDLSGVPEGQFTEIAYEDLEVTPVEQLEKIYRDLNLGDFGEVKPAVERYLQSIQGYQKNRHAKLDPATRERIAKRWSRTFKNWGYPT